MTNSDENILFQHHNIKYMFQCDNTITKYIINDDIPSDIEYAEIREKNKTIVKKKQWIPTSSETENDQQSNSNK